MHSIFDISSLPRRRKHPSAPEFPGCLQGTIKTAAATVTPCNKGLAGLITPEFDTNGDGVVQSLLKRFQKDVSGATAIEYALIAGLISIVIVGGATSIGGRLVEIFTSVNAGFPA